MKTIKASGLAVLFVCGAVSAASLSDQDINLLVASAKTVQAYKQGGMTAVVNSIQQCYDKIGAAKQAAKKEVEFCIAQDLSGFTIDLSAVKANGFPRDQRFTEEAIANRIHLLLLKSGISKNGADTQNYLKVRSQKVERFTNNAIEDSPPPQASNDADTCVEKKVAAWEKARSKEIDKKCAFFTKRGQECRISAGQEELLKEEATDKIKADCRRG